MSGGCSRTWGCSPKAGPLRRALATIWHECGPRVQAHLSEENLRHRYPEPVAALLADSLIRKSRRAIEVRGRAAVRGRR